MQTFLLYTCNIVKTNFNFFELKSFKNCNKVKNVPGCGRAGGALDRRRITRALDWCYLEHLNVQTEFITPIIQEENLSFNSKLIDNH